MLRYTTGGKTSDSTKQQTNRIHVLCGQPDNDALRYEQNVTSDADVSDEHANTLRGATSQVDPTWTLSGSSGNNNNIWELLLHIECLAELEFAQKLWILVHNPPAWFHARVMQLKSLHGNVFWHNMFHVRHLLATYVFRNNMNGNSATFETHAEVFLTSLIREAKM
jgi:hypothetical protein